MFFGVRHEYFNAVEGKNVAHRLWQCKDYADIRAGVSGQRASNDTGVVENGNLQCFRSLYLRNL